MIKRLFFTILFAVVALGASAEFRWGPTAQVYLGNYRWKQPLIDSKMEPGFTAGIIGELMIPGIGFGIDMGVNYAMHSAKLNLGAHEVWASDGYGIVPFKLHSIEVPVHLRFKWTRMEGIEDYIAPFAFVGPVFQFHVSQTKCAAIEHPLGSVALQFGIGAEIIKRIQIFGSYEFNPTYEIQTVKLDNYSARNSGWTVGAAWLF
ncbi:MAG: hypothetical protein K2F87_00780 [Muribaculaceae bacterium]|nr:hypothetical protein [Muribaculaceae bacterium]